MSFGPESRAYPDLPEGVEPLWGEESLAATRRLSGAVSGATGKALVAFTLFPTLAATILVFNATRSGGPAFLALVPMFAWAGALLAYVALARPRWNEPEVRAQAFEALKRSTDPEALDAFLRRLDGFGAFEDVTAQTRGHLPFVLRVLAAHPGRLSYLRRRILEGWALRLERDGVDAEALRELRRRLT